MIMSGKYAQDRLTYGVILHRYYIGISPDEVGSISFWDQAVRELYAQINIPFMWEGLNLHIWHMGHPELDKRRALGEVTLEDYDLSKEGNQVAAGLFWDKSRLELGVFPPNYLPTAVAFYPVEDSARAFAKRTLSHEVGHYYSMLCGYQRNANYIQTRITEEFNNLRPNHAHNSEEDFAEVFRALFGIDEVRGYFSDNVSYKAPEKLYTLMKTGYWLVGNLSNKIITNLTFNDMDVTWQEKEVRVDKFLWFTNTRIIDKGTWSVNRNLESKRIK